MELPGLVAEPAVDQMRPGVVVVLVRMDLGPAGLVVEQGEGLARFAESPQAVQMHRCRLVELAVQRGWAAVAVQVPACQRAAPPEGYSPTLVAQMPELERRKRLVPQVDLELVLESTGPHQMRSPVGFDWVVPEGSLRGRLRPMEP
jgi:hypothetical protein